MHCYENMFDGCSNLSLAPELPATTLANSCYYMMFKGCTSLISGPSELPATTLESYCYQEMFNGCSSLTSAPEILATLRKTRCMMDMFKNCSSLNYVKIYIVNWSTSDMSGWLSGSAATGTVECPTGSTIPSDSTSGVPSGWTKVEFNESGSETDDDDEDTPFGPPGGGSISQITGD